ncbi:hypothetical protein KCP78_10875 [Salmonella enterica subsp. enterica]|nr:hypothetical protein KCP78_10875 [Salmonella enterica subsp. enterica]
MTRSAATQLTALCGRSAVSLSVRNGKHGGVSCRERAANRVEQIRCMVQAFMARLARAATTVTSMTYRRSCQKGLYRAGVNNGESLVLLTQVNARNRSRAWRS